MKLLPLVLIIGMASFIPIWRVDGDKTEGYSVYDFIKLQYNERHRVKHIQVEEAIEKANNAYLSSSIYA